MVFHLATFISSLKVASNFKSNSFLIVFTILNSKVLKILFFLGFIRGFIKNNNKIQIFLSHSLNSTNIRGCFLLSKLSSRVYFPSSLLKKQKLGKFFNINGFTLCSSNRGILTDVECLILGIGGEPLFFIF